MIIGIDGGGTKTTGVLVDLEGHILAQAMVGPTNPNSASEESVKQELVKLFGKLTEKMALPEGIVIFAGVSGVESGGKKEWMATAIKVISKSSSEIIVDNDAITALYSETKGEAGIVGICGTGSVTFGVNEAGERARVGGWGYLINDKASGFAIGRRILEYIFDQHDKGIKPCALTAAVLESVQMEDTASMIPYIYELGKTRDRVASLARVAITFSNNGDKHTTLILEEAAESMLKDIQTLYVNLHPKSMSRFPVVLTGGIIQHAECMLHHLIQETKKRGLPFNFVPSTLPPVAGAVYAAMKGRGIEVTDKFSSVFERGLLNSKSK